VRYQAALHPESVSGETFNQSGDLFVPHVAVDAFALERGVGYVALHVFRLLTLGALDFLLADLGHFHFHDKVVFAFCASVIVLRHNFDL
jgi:hypothetical protein